MIIRLLACAFVLFGPLSGVGHAGVCTVSGATFSCPGNDAYTALNQIFNSNDPRAIANGDTISFSSGTTTFPSSPLTLNGTNQKNFTIQGAGAGVTIWRGAAGFGSPNITLTTAIGTGPTRITGITFDVNGSSSGASGMLALQGRTSQLRIDRNTFIITGTAGITLFGHQAGVADHNTFQWAIGAYGIAVFNHNGQCWEGVCSFGDKSWATAHSLNSSEKLVFEDNDFDFGNWQSGDPFTYRFALDGWWGARRTERFNTYNNTVSDMHGSQESNGRARGHMQLEVYNNTFNYNITSGGYANPVDFRGGYGMVFSNTINLSNGSTINSFVNLKNLGASSGGLQPYSPFGMCGRLTDFYTLTSITSSGTTATININTTGQSPWWSGAQKNWITISGATQANYNGTFQVTVVNGTQMTYTMPGTATSPATGTIVITSPWNQNSNQYGSLCHDAPGVGPGDFLGGGDDPTPVGWTNNELRPVVGWGNTKGGVIDAMTSQMPNHIVENTHFYTEKASPSFNGTVGVGRGLRSARPATCTTGVYYWSTDGGTNWNTLNGSGVDGGLDQCTATNTWTNDVYVPFPAYPHPLIALTEGGGGGTVTVVSLTPDPSTVPVGSSTNLTVTISAIQGTNTTVAVSSSDATKATVPSTVTVTAGQLTATIPVTGVAAGTTVITATLNSTSQDSTTTVTAVGGGATVEHLFVRPTADCPINGNGLSYGCAAAVGGSGAWSGLFSMLFSGTDETVGRIDPGDTVHVCGLFTSSDKYQTTAMINSAVAGANSSKTTYDGDCTAYGGASLATLDGGGTVSLGLYTAQRANYEFANLIVRNFSSRGAKIYASAAGEESIFKGVTIRDSIIESIRGSSSICIDTRGTDISILRTKIASCGSDGIYNGGGQRMNVIDNVITRISLDILNGGDGIQFNENVSGSLVENNDIDMTFQDSKYCIHGNALTGSGTLTIRLNNCKRLVTHSIGSGITIQSAAGYTLNILSNRVVGGLYNYQIFNQDGTTNLIGNFGLTPSSDGIRLGGTTGVGPTNVYNNTLLMNVQNGIQQDNPNAVTTIKNNIIVGGVDCIDRRSGNVEDYNITWACDNPLSVAGSPGSLGANSQNTNPFLNKNNAEDYFPLLNSPALGSGVAVTGCVDVIGKACPTTPDVGAYQRSPERKRRIF